MKTKITTLIILCSLSIPAFSQRGIDTTLLKNEMQKLSWMAGTWKGEAVIQRGPGEPLKVNQEETVEFKLDGLLLFIEGIGTFTDPSTGKEKIGFNAIGLISYDPVKSQYKFRSYVNSGQEGDTYLKVIGDNRYEWGFGQSVKYNITHNPAEQTWVETGAYSQDNGSTWNNFIELKLKKIE